MEYGTFTRCTFWGNETALRMGDSGIEIDHCLIVNNQQTVTCYQTMADPPQASCTNIWGNLQGDWVACLADQQTLDGNFSLDPLFCPFTNFLLDASSPCAPPGVTGCGQVGAFGVGCGTVSTAPSTWGRIKGAYR
jgi:hypothetical protein